MIQEESKEEQSRMFGREAEKQLLCDAFDRCCCPSSHQKEVVVIDGKSGVGKTTLAYWLREYVEQTTNGMFLTGKFDQHRRPEPYSPFVTAFTEWSHRILVNPSRREELLDKSGLQEIDSLIIDTVPALKQVVARKKEKQSTDRTEITVNRTQKHRFLTAFVAFVRSITDFRNPLVLFLDDLQWADIGSLELLSILAESSIEGLMLLGACRGNEVAIHDPLAATFRELEEKQVMISEIVLSNFSNDEVREMVSLYFSSENQDLDELAEAVYQQTDGNVFYILRLLRLYQEQGCLTRNMKTNHWQWDIELMHGLKRNVSDVMREALQELPSDVQIVLQCASCLGACFSEKHIEMIRPKLDVRRALQIAAKKDLIDFSLGKCKFVHDRLQDTAYKLIPVDELPHVHASIGRTLLKSMSSEELQDNIFLVVNQLVLGMDDFCDPEDRARLAMLCLQAGEKAVASSAFGTAATYLELGIRSLEPENDPWQSHYDLCLALFNAAAEVAYCNGNFETTTDHVEHVFENAHSFEDKIQAYSTYVFALGAQQRFSEAIDTAFLVLTELGEPFPARAGKLRVVLDVLKTKRMLRRKSAEDILNLPLMTDPKKLAAFRMLNLVYLYIFFTRQAYVPLISNRFVQRTLEYGLSAMGSSGFGMYGMLLCGIFGEIDEGYKYCQIALRMLDKFPGQAYKARVYTPVYGMVAHWKKPVRTTLEHLKAAHRAGLETGDIEFALLAASLYCFNCFFAGVRLPALREEMFDIVEETKAHKQDGILSLLRPAAQLVDCLMGLSSDPTVLAGHFMDEASFLHNIEYTENSTQFNALNLRRLLAGYYMNNLSVALDATEKSKGLATGITSSISASLRAFFGGLTYLALARKTSRKRPYLKHVRQFMKKLKKWSSLSPHNFLNKLHLLEAELTMVVTADLRKARPKYESAMSLAENEGFLHDYALACERFSGACRESGDHVSSSEYLAKARSLYAEWGAAAKVNQLDDFLVSLKREQST